MALAPGTKLGPYDIIESIGVGGMGEVYRARDAKLGRDVAVKILSGDFAGDPDRLARFDREARLLAQLNHPNIATLYGLDEADGQKLLVMELVEGETLAETIARGTMTLDEARGLFLQIAEGLEAAHEKGVIHRDLKPANIKITPDGKVKILDFGLAKAFAPDDDAPADASSQSPTLTKGTALGAIMGTASYMSPEQARGKRVDRRTDVWAFGCCLYEALTGRPAFGGETVTDILGAVVGKEPDLERVPASARELARRCLTKDATWRLQHIGDARLELCERRDREEQANHASPAWKVVATLATATAVALALWRGSNEPTIDTRRFEITFPPSQSPNFQFSPQLSPDGRRILYSSVDRNGVFGLFIRELDQLEARPVSGSAGARMAVFSPDGTEIAFSDRDGIRRIRVEGGEAVDVSPSTRAWWAGMDWGSDDTLVFSEGANGLFRVSTRGSDRERLTDVDENANELSHIEPTFLPGGESILFTVISGRNDVRTEVLSLETKERRTLEGVGPFARYVPTGHALYPRGGQMLLVPFDPVRLKVTGREAPLGFPVGSRGEAWREEPPYLHFTNSGTLIYVPPDGFARRERRLVWMERNGRKQVITTIGSRRIRGRLSPDGRKLAIHDDNFEIWVHALEGRSPPRRMTFHRNYRYPIWSPDGQRLAFVEPFGSAVNVLSLASDGSETEPKLLTSFFRDQVRLFVVLSCWSPDGSEILASDRESIWVIPIDDSLEPRRLLESPFRENHPAISPDGRWLAYVSTRQGDLELFVSPYPDIASRPPIQVSRNGAMDMESAWSRDGRELYFLEGNRLMAASVDNTSDELRFSTPTQLLELDSVSIYSLAFDVAPDGRFLLSEPTANVRSRAVIVENWFEELERLAPTDD